MHHVVSCAWCLWRSRECDRSLELELETFVATMWALGIELVSLEEQLVP